HNFSQPPIALRHVPCPLQQLESVRETPLCEGDTGSGQEDMLQREIWVCLRILSVCLGPGERISMALLRQPDARLTGCEKGNFMGDATFANDSFSNVHKMQRRCSIVPCLLNTREYAVTIGFDLVVRRFFTELDRFLCQALGGHEIVKFIE